MTVQKICLFLAIIVQMGHNQRDTDRLQVDTIAVSHGLLWKHCENKTESIICLDFYI
jgi:hypothetical protein